MSASNSQKAEFDRLIDEVARFTNQAPMNVRAFLGAIEMCGYTLQPITATISAGPDDEAKDAARYRYLRNTPPWKSPVTVIKSRDIGDDIAMLIHEGLDAVIDMALPKSSATDGTVKK